VFGKYNAKDHFVPKIVAKTDETKLKIKARLNQAFMFKALNKEELDIVIGAMAEKRVKAGENVI